MALVLLAAAAWSYWSQPALTDYGTIAWYQRLLSPVETNAGLRSISGSHVTLSPGGDKALIVANGGLYMSADKGARWRRLAGSLPDVHLNAVAASADGRRIIAIDPQGLLIRSRDGGESWATTSTGEPHLWQVALSSDGMRGLITSGQGSAKAILRTTDGGETWTRVVGPKGTFNLALSADGMRAIVLTEDKQDTSLAHSTDGGATWTEQVIRGTRLWAVALSRSGLIGYAVGAKGEVLQTTDGGATWARRPASEPELALWHVAVSANGQRAAVIARTDAKQSLVLTEDGGATWRPASLPFGLWPLLDGIALSGDGMTALLVGTAGRAGIWRSGDGGLTWEATNATTRTVAWWAYGAVAIAVCLLGFAAWPRRQGSRAGPGSNAA